jgi:hypothetical protein
MKDSPQPANVVVVFKTHLDVGFTESAAKVRHDYINWQVFSAISANQVLRDEGMNFTWTLPSWVVWEALERHKGKKLEQLEEGIAAGALAWHALPFTTHTEYIDESLFEFGISMARLLDERFGVRTIAAKMTDVPGHTIAMVPLLAKSDVRFLHIGVNWACPKPDVPELFRWKAPTGEEVMVLYSPSYAADHMHPDGSSFLAFRMFGDNMDIAAPDEIRAWFKQLREQFPKSKIKFGRLDDHAAALESIRDTLPVVTQEIGDSWIHGVGSDPKKTAQFRELSRLRREWLQSGKLMPTSKSYVDFSKNLLLVGEHTWSISQIPMLAEEKATMNNEEFHRRRPWGLYQTVEASFQEQRDYLERAVDSLADTSVHAEARAALNSPHSWTFVLPGEPSRNYTNEDFSKKIGAFMIETKKGVPGLSSLQVSGLSGEFKSPSQPLLTLGYQSFSKGDYDRYISQYVRSTRDPENAPDFYKPGLELTKAEGKFWEPALVRREVSEDDKAVGIRDLIDFPEESWRDYGAPRTAEILIRINKLEPTIDVLASWKGKTATRRPEALWFHAGLALPEPEKWRVEKLGREIDFLDVIGNGGHKLHATDRGVVWNGASRKVRIDSPDAALVSPGRPALAVFDNKVEPLNEGMHFPLWNNIWGTNFPAWYDEDATFRFRLNFNA